MSPLFGKDKGEDKDKDKDKKSSSEDERKESKLVSSYNLTYEQIKKQEMGETEEEKQAAAEPAAPPKEEKKKTSGRFSRLASQFKRVDVKQSFDTLREQQQGNVIKVVSWFKEHKLASIIGIVVVGMVLAWGLSKILFKEKKQVEETGGVAVADVGTRVNVLKISKTDFSDSILAMGTIKGFAQVNLGFQVAGNVSAFYFREGDEIKAGQIISQLDPQEQLLKYEKAKVDYSNAQSLYDLGAIIPAKLEEARINLELAENDLSKTAIIAPSDGILGSREVEVGSAVTPNMKIGVFLDIDDVFAEVGIMEREINKVVLGQSVKINVDAYPDLDFGGTVTNVAPMVKGKSKTLNVKVQIANPYRLLLPGMFVRVRIKIFETKNAIIIPRPALKKVKGAYHVFTVNQNNKAEFKTVKLGYVTTDNVQITEGINEGELVVVEGMEELKDGAKVQIMEYQSSAF
ncbi:efflux RND transporter periplasmic adaptor subunit [candidate division FCPU426 bacterium]|nr:efflux RND transporter periplasmic adaptor subunit [candidate division FCPU426 bacterium]